MLTKTKIALIAALIAGSASAALAQAEFDPNLANRYPADAGRVVTAPQGTFQSAPVALYDGRNVSLSRGQSVGADQTSLDRASRTIDSGGL